LYTCKWRADEVDLEVGIWNLFEFGVEERSESEVRKSEGVVERKAVKGNKGIGF
jgi:hypothetical protein